MQARGRAKAELQALLQKKSSNNQKQRVLMTIAIVKSTLERGSKIKNKNTIGDIGNRTRDLFYAKEALYH